MGRRSALQCAKIARASHRQNRAANQESYPHGSASYFDSTSSRRNLIAVSVCLRSLRGTSRPRSRKRLRLHGRRGSKRRGGSRNSRKQDRHLRRRASPVDDEDVESFVGPDTDVRDLAGKMVLPGLHDVHLHPLWIAKGDICDLESRPRTLDAYVPFLSGCLNRYQIPEGEWLWADQWNFSTGNQPSERYPTMRAALDAVSTQHPIVLLGNDGHHTAVNSAALARARTPAGEAVGLTAETLQSTFRVLSGAGRRRRVGRTQRLPDRIRDRPHGSSLGTRDAGFRRDHARGREAPREIRHHVASRCSRRAGVSFLLSAARRARRNDISHARGALQRVPQVASRNRDASGNRRRVQGDPRALRGLSLHSRRRGQDLRRRRDRGQSARVAADAAERGSHQQLPATDLRNRFGHHAHRRVGIRGSRERRLSRIPLTSPRLCECGSKEPLQIRTRLFSAAVRAELRRPRTQRRIHTRVRARNGSRGICGARTRVGDRAVRASRSTPSRHRAQRTAIPFTPRASLTPS